MRRILALSLLAPALVAQVPEAKTLAQKVFAESKAIKALKLENPALALEKAKALLPAAKPNFDKSSLQTAYASIREWNAYIDVHRLIYSAGVASGHFEEAMEAYQKARDTSKELQGLGTESFNAYKATWEKASEDSAKLLEEIKNLQGKVEASRLAKPDPNSPKMTMEEANAKLMEDAAMKQRLEYLKSNESTYKENIEKVKTVMVPLERPAKELEAQTHEFDNALTVWEKYIPQEAEDISSKYKGDKAKYAAGLLRGVAPKPEDKEAALVSLHRAMFLDPSNHAIQARIDQLMGKASAPAAKPTKAKGKSKK